MKKKKGPGYGKLTSGLAAADGAVGRVVEVAADIADFRVEEAFPLEMPPVEVLRAPEAAGGDGAALCALRDGTRGG